MLSVVNSIYDPLGLAVPVLLEGRLLLQQLVRMGKRSNNDAPLGWDDPLPDALRQQWHRWRSSLPDLEKIAVPRCYHPQDFGKVARAEIHAFSDASKDAIGASVYLRLANDRGDISTTLLFGQSKVAPAQATSIPRLELCGAVLAALAVQRVQREIDIGIDEVSFYTDSKVVLGYIQNECRRFYVYVANRVQIIRKISIPSQWRYVDTKENPADFATRGLSPNNLAESIWLTGPRFLKEPSLLRHESEEIPLDESDPEVRKEATNRATHVQKRHGLGSERFSRFSSLRSLQRAIANLIVVVREFKRRKNGPGAKPKVGRRNAQTKLRSPTVKEQQQAIGVIVRTVQGEAYSKELGPMRSTVAEQVSNREQVTAHKQALKKSDLRELDPFLDDEGILRAGGRLRRAKLLYGEKHPALLPKDHHVSHLIVRHYHAVNHHQGRQITHGAIRQAGYWLIGGHRLVSSELQQCVTCRKLRGQAVEQRMADLPADRTEVAPPFTNVGFDVFGPWPVQTRKMRGGAANSKRWGLVFTCLSSRAVHIEVLESMDASSFICALRRFFALRGPASVLRCDRGTNFVGGKSEFDAALKEMDQKKIERYAKEEGCEWVMNPPHASHFGGVWERQIGTIRRVLDAMFAQLGSTQLSHELLVTLMAEVTAIVNARPITPIPSDADDPRPLSPAMLLTMKTRPLGPPPGNFLPSDLYARRRWRRIQYLADQFWVRWRREYLQSLQRRRKWNTTSRDLTIGDVVIMKEEGAHRNSWPMGRVSNTIRSKDGHVRTVEVTLVQDGKRKTFLRPVKELVLLLPTGPEHAEQ